MFFSLVLCLALNSSNGAELISAGVGVVKGQVVTSREVQIANLLELALYDKNFSTKAKILAIDSKAFARATQEALLESVVTLEAHNFNVVQITSEDRRDAEKKAVAKLKGLKVWKSLAVSERELSEAIRKKIQAKKFIQFRSESSVLPITDAEAQRYFDENQIKFGSLPFENFKENIKSYLSRTQVDRRLKDWYDILLNKYQVKNLIAEL